MAYTITLHRSPNGTTWTQIASWTTNGGNVFNDFFTDTPGAGTWYYEMRVASDDAADLAGPRRMALIAGNR
jgi:hypothetical protein